MYSNTGSFTGSSALRAVVPGLPASVAAGDRTLVPRDASTACWDVGTLPGGSAAHSDGLLHDARNLMGALGLYCDLLSMPGVLKPEHRHYAEEVRLLGARSTAMIQQLMERRGQAPAKELGLAAPSARVGDGILRGSAEAGVASRGGQAGSEAQLVSLRAVVERCWGLLQRVACGRTIEVEYGVAASVPVQVAEEAVERILVNLVRNASAALGQMASAGGAVSHTSGGEGAVCEAPGRAVGGVIRISVGMLVNRVGDPKPWPFRRVRLVVEDSGCGMTQEQLERLLSGRRAPSRGCHGIGFGVVKELVGASDGDLRVMSSPGAGTRVQIEWRIAGDLSSQVAERDQESSDRAEGRQPC